MSPPLLRDLRPRYDVKGGSPRTPSGGIPVREVQEYSTSDSGFIKMVAGAGYTGWLMAILAWWTAFQGKGITRDELRNEMKEYKDSIMQHSAVMDGQIGELKGRQEKIITDLNGVQYKQLTDERDFEKFQSETKQTNKLVSDLLEGQKVKK